MVKTDFNCSHSSKEQTYICLAETCIKESKSKLGCYKCLLEAHKHSECMEHIDDVHKAAEANQQAFLELIKTYEQYCEKANISITENIDAIRKRISEWLDSLLTHYQGQVIAYQEILSQQKTFINSAQISKDNLDQLIEFRCLNSDSYQQKNQKIQQQLEINKQSFLGYFDQQFQKIQDNLRQQPIDKFLTHKISLKYIPIKNPQLQVCQQNDCQNVTDMLCLHQDCLQNQPLILECSQCITKRHCDNQSYDQHKQYFIKALQLHQLQEQKFQEITNFCKQKEQQISLQNKNLEQIINEQILLNERKLLSLKQYLGEKENEFQQYLQKFQDQYNLDMNTIYKDLLEQFDQVKQAEILSMLSIFDEFSQSIKKYHQMEKENTSLGIQELWKKGLKVYQLDDLTKFEKCITPLGKFIDQQTQKANFLEKQTSQLQQKCQTLEQQIEVLSIESQNFQKQVQGEQILLKQIEQLNILIQTLKDTMLEDHHKHNEALNLQISQSLQATQKQQEFFGQNLNNHKLQIQDQISQTQQQYSELQGKYTQQIITDLTQLFQSALNISLEETKKQQIKDITDLIPKLDENRKSVEQLDQLCKLINENVSSSSQELGGLKTLVENNFNLNQTLVGKIEEDLKLSKKGDQSLINIEQKLVDLEIQQEQQISQNQEIVTKIEDNKKYVTKVDNTSVETQKSVQKIENQIAQIAGITTQVADINLANKNIQIKIQSQLEKFQEFQVICQKIDSSLLTQQKALKDFSLDSKQQASAISVKIDDNQKNSLALIQTTQQAIQQVYYSFSDNFTNIDRQFQKINSLLQQICPAEKNQADYKNQVKTEQTPMKGRLGAEQDYQQQSSEIQYSRSKPSQQLSFPKYPK